MYKNILVPVALDHSPRADKALTVARTLASEGARITALHIIEDIPSYVQNQIPADVLSDREPEAKAALVAALGDAADVEAVVVFGHPGQTIVEFADQHDVDCIVIASHRPGLQDFLLGSTAQRVVRHAHCAVHVLR